MVLSKYIDQQTGNRYQNGKSRNPHRRTCSDVCALRFGFIRSDIQDVILLQQNDILYVTPNKTKAQSADIGTSTTMWVSGFSILVSIASLLVNILR